MSPKSKKTIKLSIITQKVNETRGKINLPRIWWQPSRKMDPSWPYASSRAFYMPFTAVNSDPRISFGHQEVNCQSQTRGYFDGSLLRYAPSISLTLRLAVHPTCTTKINSICCAPLKTAKYEKQKHLPRISPL